MRYALVALLLIVAVPCAAQNVWSFEARSLAMGNAVVPVADDSAAWLQNPAGLPWVQPCGVECADATSRASATTDLGSRVDTIGFNFSSRDRANRHGWGAGYWDLGRYELGPMIALSIERYGAGYGARATDQLSWGVTVAQVDFDWSLPPVMMPAISADSIAAYQGNKTIVDAGLMYRQISGASEIKWAVVGRDVTDNMQFTLDVGASIARNGVLVAAELRDLTDEVDGMLNLGAEWRPRRQPRLTVLGGLADGDLTYGLGWDFDRWAVSLARQHLDWDTETAVSLAASF